MPKANFWSGGRGDSGHGRHNDTAEALRLMRNFEESHQGWFWSIDAEGRLTYLSESVAERLGIEHRALLGSPFVDLFVPIEEEANTSRTLPFILVKRSKIDRLTLRSAMGGEERWWSISGNPQFDSAGQFTGYRGSGVDITEQHKSSKQASRLAMYDALTGLPNRLRMADVLEASLHACEIQRRPCAVIMIDLDRFKQVNDTMGHPAGDILLKQVAERLRRIVGEKDKVFRLGGDEFQMIVPDSDDRGFLGNLATDIITTLSQPYSVEGSRCIIGASVGIAISPADGRKNDELIRNADLALYAAKGSGRGRFRFFSSDLLEAAEDRRRLEEDLRDALAKGEIELGYQPVVSARTDCVTAVEALIRWRHPVRGPISPALFIPIAEEAKLIEPLGEWVMRKACEDAATWPGKVRVAVNVSPIQFANEALPKIVMSALASSGLPPDRLELEITEGVFLSEGAETDTMFSKLKEIGVRLALDDFGTGYSSLGYLRTAPFDKIKIDQSFVRDATVPGSRNVAIISAIVALADALSMETTAEGIESMDQLQLIRSLGVSHVQGYVYSNAVDTEKLRQRLESGDWVIPASGPAKQRSDRQAMYRKAAAIYGNRYKSILIRNLSKSGALIEGLADVPMGSLLVIDFGDGQLEFARVTRALGRQQGIAFEQPLVSDGNNGLCTSQRVSSYALSRAGLPHSNQVETKNWDLAVASSIEELSSKLGLHPATSGRTMGGHGSGGSGKGSSEPGGPGAGFGASFGAGFGAGSGAGSGTGTGTGSGAGKGFAGRSVPTIRQLSVRYLDHIGGDQQQHDIDYGYLRSHILPRFGHLRLDEVIQSDVEAWLTGKSEVEGCPPATASRLQAILTQMGRLAMQWDLPGAALNALLAISSINARDELQYKITQAELEQLLDAIAESYNPHLKFIVPLVMLTGESQRELLAAKWTDIDTQQAIWSIPVRKSAQVRTVNLSAAAVEILGRLPRWNDCPWLIANPRTKEPYRSLSKSLETVRAKADLAHIEIDDLRFCGVGGMISEERLLAVAVSTEDSSTDSELSMELAEQVVQPGDSDQAASLDEPEAQAEPSSEAETDPPAAPQPEREGPFQAIG